MSEIVRAVVQGKLPLSALEEAGVTVEVEQEQSSGNRRTNFRITSPIRVEPRPVDIATGMLAYKSDPEKLREWASFVLSASEILDLEPLNSWPEGDELLSALWDASFEGHFGEGALKVASALAEE